MPTYLLAEMGTAVVWGHPSGSGVTHNLSINNLANAAGRMGVYADLGATWNQLHILEAWVETGTAPTAGATCEVYLAFSRDGSNWPGKVDGTDAAYPATVASNKLQLGLPYVLVATNDTNTTIRQNAVLVRPRAQYVAPVFVNLLGQATRNQATPANNTSRVFLTAYKESVQ